MPDDKKEDAIIIPRMKSSIQIPKIMKREQTFSGFYFLIIFLLFIGLLILLAFLPINLAFKIIALVFGTFILEDLFHSFKTLCQHKL